MSQVEQAAAKTRGAFFQGQNNKVKNTRSSGIEKIAPQRNDPIRQKEIESTTNGDAKVQISDAIKDFARIKKVADAAPQIDNTEKVARLKAQVADGSYKVDYDALANKILEQEF